MELLGPIIVQVMAFSAGLLVLGYVAIGIYMRVSHRDPFSRANLPQPRSQFQWLVGLFLSLWLFTFFLGQAVPSHLEILRISLLIAGILFLAASVFFLVKLLRAV